MSNFYEQMDIERNKAMIEAFIKIINEDHYDSIPITRTQGCMMRDEILRLRKKAGETA